MKALIMTADGAEDTELLVPYYRLKEEGVEVDVAAPERGEVTGKHGYSLEANRTLSEVKAGNYDLLFLPGGKAPETVRMNPNAVAVALEMLEDGKPVAAICHGAQVLISGGALRGRHATCWPAIQDDLLAAGADFRDEEVVVDRNLITSRCPGDLPAFCRELVRAVRAA